jgi:Holliday junction DNA helicase RuvB
MLSKPLLSRFGIQERLDFYQVSEIVEILSRAARVLGLLLSPGAAFEIAKRSRGTPRIANRLLRRVADFSLVQGDKEINAEIAAEAMTRQDVDEEGLDSTDRKVLFAIRDRFGGGPVGIESLSVALGEDKGTLEEVNEPYLVYKGFIVRGPRGRMLSPLAIEYLRIVGQGN